MAEERERARQERHQFTEALEEDRDRTAARLAQERHRQRIDEAVKSARLRELRLAKEAAETRAKAAPRSEKSYGKMEDRRSTRRHGRGNIP